VIANRNSSELTKHTLLNTDLALRAFTFETMGRHLIIERK